MRFSSIGHVFLFLFGVSRLITTYHLCVFLLHIPVLFYPRKYRSQSPEALVFCVSCWLLRARARADPVFVVVTVVVR